MKQHSKLADDDPGRPVFLVTGATGTVGSAVVKALLSSGQKVRALTRNPSKAKFPDAVEVFEGNLEKPETLEAALKNVVGLHLITFTGPEYTPLQSGPELMAMARASGVKRITVLWSGEGKKSPVEQAVEVSDLEWTTLQPQEYMANVLTWQKAIAGKGIVAEPFGLRPTAAIHEDDIGSVAASILINGRHSGKTYTLTGPEVLTPQDQVATIKRILNKNVRFVELSEAEALDRWKQHGYSDELANYLLQWYKNPPAEGYTVLSTVENITGRPPRSFSQWVLDHAQQFI